MEGDESAIVDVDRERRETRPIQSTSFLNLAGDSGAFRTPGGLTDDCVARRTDEGGNSPAVSTATSELEEGGRKGRTNRWPFSRKTITVIITRRSAAMTATAATARHSYVRHKYVPRLHGKEDAPRANAVKMPNEAGCVIMQKRSLEIPKICSLRI